MSSQRSPDDTWDISTSVGMTAVMVAGARAAEHDLLHPLVRDPYARLLVDNADVVSWTNMLDAKTIAKVELIDSGIAAVLTRSRNYQAVRTYFFDAFFTDAISAGIRQIVNLASGLDTRAYRLRWPTGTMIFEIDQPRVLEYKFTTLAAHGVTSAVGLRGVAIDLRSDWPRALAAAGFDRSQPTAWLAEGLLAYLSADDQDKLFEDITTVSPPGSQIAAEAMGTQSSEQRTDLKSRFRDVSRQLGMTAQVNVGSLVYHEPNRADPAEWLNRHGWNANVAPAKDEMVKLGRWSGAADDTSEAFLSFVVGERT